MPSGSGVSAALTPPGADRMAQTAQERGSRASRSLSQQPAIPGRSQLRLRVYSSLVGVPGLLLMIWLGVPATAALVSAAAVIGVYEFHRLTIRAGATVMLLLGIIATVLFTVDAVVDFNLSGPLITGTVLAPLLLLVFLPPRERFLADWAWTLAGVFLVGWSLSHAVLIRSLVEGREWLLTVVILTFAVDTGAYTVGRLVGRRALAPAISRGKTWEGAIGGVAAGIIAAVATTIGFDLEIDVWGAVVLGLLVAVFAQGGDLTISLIKRTAGFKDTGAIIPGHGGILDRLDSMIFAVVVLYYYLTKGIGVP